MFLLAGGSVCETSRWECEQACLPCSQNQLDAILPLVPNAMVQEEIEGSEITVDGLLDMEGHCIHYVPRLRLKTSQGVSSECHHRRPRPARLASFSV